MLFLKSNFISVLEKNESVRPSSLIFILIKQQHITLFKNIKNVKLFVWEKHWDGKHIPVVTVRGLTKAKKIPLIFYITPESAAD